MKKQITINSKDFKNLKEGSIVKLCDSNYAVINDNDSELDGDLNFYVCRLTELKDNIEVNGIKDDNTVILIKFIYSKFNYDDVEHYDMISYKDISEYYYNINHISKNLTKEVK